MSFEELAKQPFWIAVPAVLWFCFGVFALLLLRSQISNLVSSTVQRLKSGAALKLGAIEVGEIRAVPSASALAGTSNPLAVADDGKREKERSAHYERCRGAMLVHKIFRSDEPGQRYDTLVYVIPHGTSSLAGVACVEYYFGKMWGSKVFTSSDRGMSQKVLT